jgi:hypothetical protein
MRAPRRSDKPKFRTAFRRSRCIVSALAGGLWRLASPVAVFLTGASFAATGPVFVVLQSEIAPRQMADA